LSCLPRARAPYRGAPRHWRSARRSTSPSFAIAFADVELHGVDADAAALRDLLDY
jgi:hypothetical protein